MPELTTFGEPNTLQELDALQGPAWQARLARLGDLDAALRAALQQAVHDQALVDVGGRWQPGQPDPAEFVPGDALALRLYAAVPTLHQAELRQLILRTTHPAQRPPWVDRAVDLPATAVWSMRATPFYLPVAEAVGIMASHPPEPGMLTDLRLPFETVTVYFGADLAIPRELQRWSSALDDPDRGLPAALAAQFLGLPPLDRTRADLVWAARELGGYLSGVTLFAGGRGRGVADDVLWLVTTNPDPAAPGVSRFDRIRGVVPGRLSCSTLQPLAVNLAAAVAWGAWRTPAGVELPGAPGSRAWRKAVRRGTVRRADRRGGLAGVRVLDIARMRQPTRSQPHSAGAEPRPSPVTHLRRGHWRRVRVGPRDAWHHEGRWIPPAVVNPGGPPKRTVTVYRLPAPDAPAASRHQPASLAQPAPPRPGHPPAPASQPATPRPAPPGGLARRRRR
jgi:hypothetical protein